MYYLIESTPNQKNVIGTFNSQLEAENKAIELHNNYCDYTVAKAVVSDLTISLDEQQTILDLLHHYRRTTDSNKDVYATNKQALLVKLNNNKIYNRN